MNASWLTANIGADAAGVVGYVLAALAALLAAGAGLMLVRRKSRRSARKSGHRVSVHDTITIDNRRRLVLVRRDNVEHLLLTGGDSDLVVETFTDFPDNREHEIEARPPISRPDNMKPITVKGEAAAPAAAKARMDNAYMARPQLMPQPGNAERAERQRDFATEKAIARRVRRDMPPSREARSYQQSGFGGQYPQQGAPYNPDNRAEEWNEAAYRNGTRPDNGWQEANMWPDEMEHKDRSLRDMPANPAPRQANPGNPAAFAAPRSNGMAHNGQNGAYPHAYPAAERSNGYAEPENGRRRDFNDMTEAMQSGGAYPSYPPREDRQAGSYNNSAPRNGQNTPPPQAMPPRGNDNAAMANGSAQTMANGAQNSAARPIMTENYAPYIGYNMPQPGAQPPLSANNGRNPALRERMAPHSSDRQDRNGDNIASFEERQNGRPVHNGGMSGNTGRDMPSERNNADMRAPIMRRQNFQNREDMNMGNGFDLTPPNSGNGFAKVNPPEDDDFDKILQDELLRAPNGIKFPSSPKK